MKMRIENKKVDLNTTLYNGDTAIKVEQALNYIMTRNCTMNLNIDEFQGLDQIQLHGAVSSGETFWEVFSKLQDNIPIDDITEEARTIIMFAWAQMGEQSKDVMEGLTQLRHDIHDNCSLSCGFDLVYGPTDIVLLLLCSKQKAKQENAVKLNYEVTRSGNHFFIHEYMNVNVEVADNMILFKKE